MSANVQTGSLGVPHLEELWRRATRPNTEAPGPQNWDWDRVVIEGLNLPLEETLQYLARQRPSLADFEKWILERNEGSIEPLRIERINATVNGDEYSDELKAAIRTIDETDPVLKAADLSFWEENGYVIVHDAITPEACLAAELAVWQTLKMNPHWDTNLTPPIPFDVSGLIYLTDTEAQQGAFTCVPGFHRRIDGWLAGLPPTADPRRQDLELLGPAPIAGRAGDLIIWHKALPHGSRPNQATRPRIVQYVSMHQGRVPRNRPWQ